MIFSHLEERLEEEEGEEDALDLEINIFLHDAYGSELHETHPTALEKREIENAIHAAWYEPSQKDEIRDELKERPIVSLEVVLKPRETKDDSKE